MKMIRWQGFIAFVLIVVTIALGWYLFAGTAIKWALEAAGEEVFNAKVTVHKVELNYSPAMMTISSVQVADEEQALKNLFEFEKAVVGIELLKLFMGQIIIDDLRLTGIEVGTDRNASGLLASSSTASNATKEKDAEPGLLDDMKKGAKDAVGETPDAKTLLAREPLKTDAAYQELNKTITESKEQWASIKADLPTDKNFDDYEVKVKALLSGDIASVEDFQKRKKQLDKVQADIKKDKQRLVEAKEQLQQGQKQISQQLSALKRAPKEDYRHLKHKYRLDAGGMANISGLIFGPEIGAYSHTALRWYEKAQPIIQRINSMTAESETEESDVQRLSGRFVRYPEHIATPDFLIKQGQLSAITEQGLVDIRIVDVTHQQNIIQRPTTVHITAEKLADFNGVDINAVLDHRQIPAIDSVTLNIASMVIKDKALSNSESMSIKLQQATAVVSGEAVFTEGALEGRLANVFQQVDFVSGGDNSTSREVARALESINSFDLNIGFKGAVDDLDLSINSTLDKQLKSAFSKRLKAKQKEFEAKLNAALEEKLATYLGDVDLGGDGHAEEKSLSKNISQLDELLEAKVDNYADQQKVAAQREADKKEAEAKRKADEKKKKEKDKLKGKLKSLF